MPPIIRILIVLIGIPLVCPICPCTSHAIEPHHIHDGNEPTEQHHWPDCPDQQPVAITTSQDSGALLIDRELATPVDQLIQPTVIWPHTFSYSRPALPSKDDPDTPPIFLIYCTLLI